MLPMAIKPILIHPDPRLKKVCDPVTEFDAALARLADDMIETMYDAVGIGLAAPQVGEMQRLFVMDCASREDATPDPMIFVNPQVSWESDEINEFEEGCLSIPGQYAPVERPASVRFTWQDVSGASHEEEFDTIYATCAQHEMDHLNGVLFIDHLKPLKRQMITRKMQKLKREQARA